MCVPSCKNLEPIAYIYIDGDNSNKETCIRKCPDNYYVDYTDLDKPKCKKIADAPANYYLDTITDGVGIYVQSCKDLVPTAYINDDGSGVKKCVRKCPETADGKIYVDGITDPNNPECTKKCLNTYIDTFTINGIKRCVSSCKNLEPTAYILKSDPINNNYDACVRACPYDASGDKYYLD